MLFVVYIALLFVYLSDGCEFRTFRDNAMTVSRNESGSDGRKITVDGCLDSMEDVLYVECTNQSIRSLNKGALSNLPVRRVIFSNDEIQYIEPGAFRNLPKLEHLDLQKNQIRTIERGTFDVLSSLRVLLLNDNDIRKVDNLAFSNMANLNELVLQNNKINTWPKYWFYNNTSLQRLNLNGNAIELLPFEAFLNMQRITFVHLQRNGLKEIHPKAFEFIHNLHTLDLGENELKELHRNTFVTFNGDLNENNSTGLYWSKPSVRKGLLEAFAGIQRLSLYRNKLTFLPDKVLDDLTRRGNLDDIHIHSNPWQCACYKKILSWAFRNKVEVDDFLRGCIHEKNPVCVVPEKNSDRCVQALDEDLYSVYIANYKVVTRERDFFDDDVTCR